MPGQPIILFDGVCNFCNNAVNFVIRRDPKSIFKFATLQGPVARDILKSHNFDNTGMSSFFLIENGKLYSKSTAALRVCRRLKGFWPLMYGFIIVPKLFRNGIYDWIAKNRYTWFGKKDVCMIPSPDVRARFLNNPL